MSLQRFFLVSIVVPIIFHANDRVLAQELAAGMERDLIFSEAGLPPTLCFCTSLVSMAG